MTFRFSIRASHWVAVTACVTVSIASAQETFTASLPADFALLAGQNVIQLELQLSTTQKEAAAQLGVKARRARQDLFALNLTIKETQESAAEIADQHLKALEEFLRPQQLHRLNEIAIQFRMSLDWNNALAKDLAEKLMITEEQKGKLLKLRAEQRKEIIKLLGSGIPDVLMKAREARERQKGESLDLLTDVQKQTLGDLQGKEFDVAKIDNYARLQTNPQANP